MISHHRGGSIILMASMSGSIVNYPQVHAAYGTSKAAVLHLTRLMAAELAVHKIRVDSISPAGGSGILRNWVSPVVLLASEAGSFMTGSDVKVDGGYCLT